MRLDTSTKRAKTGRQTSLESFFVRKRPPSPSLMPPPSKRSRPLVPGDAFFPCCHSYLGPHGDLHSNPITIDADPEDLLAQGGDGEQMSTTDIVQAPEQDEEDDIMTVDAMAEEVRVDKAQEYTEVVNEDMPSRTADFKALAREKLKEARKAKNYASEVWYASLSDFYHWTTRQGRISASNHVSRNQGRGKYFAWALRRQAWYFKLHQALCPSWKGKQVVSGSLLDNEDLYLGLQRWLRTLEVGIVSLKLCNSKCN